ncbi:MAG: hypothetical protein NDI81_04555 [Desulfobacula sp.]|jgi:hypothetical protein|nr:hypothetical protein [Desulfobacula sp.]MDA8133339.1 hypothetical protein [Desulfobacteraceae bacterium]
MNTKNNRLTADPPKEDVLIRCPRLGHEIYFNYCRVENNGLPCFKTLDCWFNYFDVQAHLKEKMTVEDFEKVFLNVARPKIHALFDLIQKTKDQEGSRE